MYPQHPELLVLAAEARRQELLASAERVRPVPPGLGPGYRSGAPNAVRRLLARLIRRRVGAAPAGAGERWPAAVEPAP